MSLATVPPPVGRFAGSASSVTTAVNVARHGPWVAGGLLVFAAVWLSALAHDSLAPPVDTVEQLTWVRSLEWGYYKHPPLPTWLAWLPVRVFGLSAWTGYVMGAACTLAALGLMWRLLVTLRGPAFAGVALLAALCITYYNGRLHYYNHNVVLLLLSTASAALCWQAFSTRQWRWWFGLGLAIGLGALAKYQIAVTVASVLVFAVHQRAWRDPVHRWGALLAGSHHVRPARPESSRWTGCGVPGATNTSLPATPQIRKPAVAFFVISETTSKKTKRMLRW